MKTIRPNYYKIKIPLRCTEVLDLDTDENLVTECEVECFDIIDGLNLDFDTGNVLKYIWRLGRKDTPRLEDAKKALTYLNRFVSKLEAIKMMESIPESEPKVE